MNVLLWSPFQSKEIVDICNHLTPDEQRRAFSHSLAYGIWVAVAAFAAVMLVLGSSSSIGVFIAVLMPAVFGVGVLGAARSLRKQKEFLCSTQWAKDQGFTPDDLRRFRSR